MRPAWEPVVGLGHRTRALCGCWLPRTLVLRRHVWGFHRPCLATLTLQPWTAMAESGSVWVTDRRAWAAIGSGVHNPLLSSNASHSIALTLLYTMSMLRILMSVKGFSL